MVAREREAEFIQLAESFGQVQVALVKQSQLGCSFPTSVLQIS